MFFNFCMCILNTNVCMIRMSVIFFSRHAFCNTFSTHDLSWRSTILSCNIGLLHYFQLTTSRGGRRYRQKWRHHAIHFSTHDLSWRSTPGIISTSCPFDFSTHDLSWRSTAWRNFKTFSKSFFNSRPLVEIDAVRKYEQNNYRFFQLTTSRGDRRSTRRYSSAD